jgi:hypothetical protein
VGPLVEHVQNLGHPLFAGSRFADDEESARGKGRYFDKLSHQRPPDETVTDEQSSNGCVLGESLDLGPAMNAGSNLLGKRTVVDAIKNICNA